MSSKDREINMVEDFIIKNDGILIKDDGFIISVSIILFTEEHGFLLCEEMRKKFPNKLDRELRTHIIGGKVDMTDTLPIYTGLREFCEELNYKHLGMSIEDTVQTLISEFEVCKKLSWDLVVSKKRQLYNRFYVINIDTLIDEELKSELLDFLLNWRKTTESALERVFFWKKGQEIEVTMTTLLEEFIKHLPVTRILK